MTFTKESFLDYLSYLNSNLVLLRQKIKKELYEDTPSDLAIEKSDNLKNFLMDVRKLIDITIENYGGNPLFEIVLAFVLIENHIKSNMNKPSDKPNKKNGEMTKDD